MGIGGRTPRGQVGGVDDQDWEFYGGDPSAAPGLARPIGWRAIKPDGTGAWDKTGIADTAWTPIGGSGGYWSVGFVRVYAVDTVAGDDANIGYADSASASTADYALACQAAGRVAKKTLAGLGAIFPRLGNRRSVEIVIANGGLNTQGTYADPLDSVLSGVSGYAAFVVRGTGTNATAGCVAFDGSAGDCVYTGAVTAPGMNSAGYKPTGTPTTTTIQALTFAGGAPGWSGAEPAAPVGYRLRFDANTATVALQNVCAWIAKKTGTDTITFPAALPAVPTTSDVFYVEQAGVVTTGAQMIHDVTAGLSGLQLVGIQATTSWTLFDCRVWMSNVQAGTFFAFNDCATLNIVTSYSHPVRGSITAGGCRSGTFTTLIRGIPLVNGLCADRLTVFECLAPSILAGTVVNTTVTIAQCGQVTIGGTGAVVSVPPRLGVSLGGITVIGPSALQGGQMEINASTGFSVTGSQVYLNFGYAQANASFSFPFDGVTKGFFFIRFDNSGAPTGDLPKKCITAWKSANPPATGGTADVITINSLSRSWSAMGAGGGSSDSAGNLFIPDEYTAQNHLKFSGVLYGAAGATITYLNDSGGLAATNQANTQQYPISSGFTVRTIMFKASVNTMANNTTVGLYQNGAQVATLTVPAGSTATQLALVTTSYTNSDTLDVALLGAAGEAGHTLVGTVMLGTS